MGQLEELQKLYVKKRTIQVGSANLTIEPLSLDDLALFGTITSDKIDPQESSKVLKSILAKSLSISEEEIAKVSIEYMTDLMDGFMKTNNMSDDDKQKASKIADFMKQKQEIKNPDLTSKITPVV